MKGNEVRIRLNLLVGVFIVIGSSSILLLSKQQTFHLDLIHQGKLSDDEKYKNGLKEEQKLFEVLRLKAVRELFSHVEKKAIEFEAAFYAQTTAEIISLGSFSIADAKKFSKFLSQALRGFTGSMDLVIKSAQADYYFFLEKHEQLSLDPAELTPDQIALFDGLQAISDTAIESMRAFVLDITSSSIKARLSAQIEEGFKFSDEQASKDYQAQLEENERGLNRNWWQEVTAMGADFIEDLRPRMKERIQKEAAKQFQDWMNKTVGTFVAEAVKKAINRTNPVSQNVTNALGKLSDQLSKEGIGVFLEHADLVLRELRKAIRSVNEVSLPVGSVVVQSDVALCVEENTFIANRMPKIQKTLVREFGINAPMRIGFCCSGGGNRAMIGTLGFMIAAARHKFLDVTLYLSGLSGSTWTIAPWCYMYLKGYLPSGFEKSLVAMRTNLIATLTDPSMIDVLGGKYLPPLLSADVKTSFVEDVAMRFGYEEPISVINIYGAMVGNYALKPAGKKRLKATWSSIAKLATLGSLPLPLCSSAFDLKKSSSSHEPYENYGWFEMSPLQAGSAQLGYIPTQYLGSEFKKGVLVPNRVTPEYPLSFFMGVYGSAISVSLNEAINFGLKNPTYEVDGVEVTVPVNMWVRNIVDANFGPSIKSFRHDIIHAKFDNYSAGLSSSLLQNEASLKMFDAGMTKINAPLPLFFDRPERALDIIILYDSNPGDIDILKNATAYFKQHSIVAPDMSKVTKKGLMSSVMTVFNDPRKEGSYAAEMPTIIYFPTSGIDIKHPPFTTVNFRYTKEDVLKLSDSTAQAFESQVLEMKKIMVLVAEARYPGSTKTAK